MIAQGHPRGSKREVAMHDIGCVYHPELRRPFGLRWIAAGASQLSVLQGRPRKSLERSC